MASVNNEEGPYFAELLRVLDESAAWAARIEPGAERLLPAPRSPLGGDDARAHPYELSHAAWHSLSHAVDHRSCQRARRSGYRHADRRAGAGGPVAATQLDAARQNLACAPPHVGAVVVLPVLRGQSWRATTPTSVMRRTEAP